MFSHSNGLCVITVRNCTHTHSSFGMIWSSTPVWKFLPIFECTFHFWEETKWWCCLHWARRSSVWPQCDFANGCLAEERKRSNISCFYFVPIMTMIFISVERSLEILLRYVLISTVNSSSGSGLWYSCYLLLSLDNKMHAIPGSVKIGFLFWIPWSLPRAI